MAAPPPPSIAFAPTTIPLASTRMQSSRRPGSSKKAGKQEEERQTVEVVIPDLVEESGDGNPEDANSREEIAKPRTLFISARGQCTTIIASQGKSDFDDDTEYLAKDDSILNRSSLGAQSLRGCIFNFFIWLKKRTRNKQVAASEDVLATYHDSFLYGKVGLTTKVRAAIRSGRWSTALLMLEFFTALFSIVLYVRSTYTLGHHHWTIVGQFVCSSFFLADYLIKLYSAPVRLYYVVSVNGVIDFISTLTLFFIIGGKLSDAAIPEVFLILRVLRAMPLLSSSLLPGGAVSKEIFLVLIYTFGVLFIAAGILQWVELIATPDSVKKENDCSGPYGCMSFYEAFYFTVVTVSTVGYGDITVKSNWGRLVALLTILSAVLLIPMEVNKIVDLASRRPYGGRYAVRKVVGSRFIIVSGNLSYRAIEDFLAEFFHPSHAKDMRAYPLRIVIMAPFKPSFEMKVLLTNYKGRVDFIEGTPLKDSDLERVSANLASAFFLMADHLAQDPDAEDSAQILRTLSVHRYCGSNVRVIVEMLKPENQDNPIWDDAEGGIEIVCPEALCYQLLARSCQIKGISTFVLNLFKAGLTIRNPIPAQWMQQYYHGQQQEIYPVILSPSFHEHKLTFDDVAEMVYSNFQVMLFALDVPMGGENMREIILYPRQRVIEPNDIGLVIAEDLTDAENVSKFGKESKTFWCAKLYKICNRGFKTSFDKDESLIHRVKRRRAKIDKSNSNSFGSDSFNTGSGRDLQKTQGPELMNFGMMKSGHRAQMQTQLREIVSVSKKYKLGSKSDDKQELLREASCKGCQQSQDTKIVQSLEKAMELAMQWPPSKKQEKPDRPILEKKMDAIAKNLEERTMEVVNLSEAHVLVCMQGKWPVNLFYFISHLRMPNLANPPIVILHPNQPALTDWGCVGMFDQVYYVKGWPVYELDLVRAGILQAEKVIILSQRGREEASKDPTNEDSGLTPTAQATLDVENVLITATAERLLLPVRDRIIVELHEENEIHYLRPKFRIDRRRFDPILYERNRSATFLFSPAFIEGKGFCSSSLTFLLYALFFNRNTVCITEKLISGGEVLDSEAGIAETGKSKLDQIALPKTYEGQTFHHLFIGLLREHHKLALGLYRPVGTYNSIVSYVYTNPLPSEILQSGDLVYVLH